MEFMLEYRKVSIHAQILHYHKSYKCPWHQSKVGLPHAREALFNAREVASTPHRPRIYRLPIDCLDQTRGGAGGTLRRFRGP